MYYNSHPKNSHCFLTLTLKTILTLILNIRVCVRVAYACYVSHVHVACCALNVCVCACVLRVWDIWGSVLDAFDVVINYRNFLLII